MLIWTSKYYSQAATLPNLSMCLHQPYSMINTGEACSKGISSEITEIAVLMSFVLALNNTVLTASVLTST